METTINESAARKLPSFSDEYGAGKLRGELDSISTVSRALIVLNGLLPVFLLLSFLFVSFVVFAEGHSMTVWFSLEENIVLYLALAPAMIVSIALTRSLMRNVRYVSFLNDPGEFKLLTSWSFEHLKTHTSSLYLLTALMHIIVSLFVLGWATSLFVGDNIDGVKISYLSVFVALVVATVIYELSKIGWIKKGAFVKPSTKDERAFKSFVALNGMCIILLLTWLFKSVLGY